MPNGIHTFKHRGRTYGMESLFSATEAGAETYHAFGREKSFLSKLISLGFIRQGDVVFHPEHWTPVDPDKGDGYHTHKYITTRGNVRLGRIQAIDRRR